MAPVYVPCSVYASGVAPVSISGCKDKDLSIVANIFGCFFALLMKRRSVKGFGRQQIPSQTNREVHPKQEKAVPGHRKVGRFVVFSFDHFAELRQAELPATHLQHGAYQPAHHSA
jgi:hypothetical protein